MEQSRTKNTTRNVASGVLSKIVLMLVPFFCRTAFLYTLGAEYLGLSSLFSSILSVLSLAELGFTNAIIYHMYKPIADKDTEKICALLAYYKKVYQMVGSFIFVVGLLLIPWLKYFINGSVPEDINIYAIYLFQLFSSASTYFLFAYKRTLLNATQRLDIVNVANMIVIVAQNLLQIAFLYLTKNYYVYITIAFVAGIGMNLFVAFLANKKYPDYQPKGNLTKDEKKDIFKQVSGVMIGKLADTSRNSFDSMVISAFLGLTMVAIYNNYYYIYYSVYGVLNIITHSMQASVGDSVAKESTEKNYRDLGKFQFIFSWIVSFCTICMVCLYQPFMKIWAGTDLMFPFIIAVLFSIYFYVINMNNMRNMYFNGSGLWWAGKLTFIYEAVGNLLLNFLLGKFFGVPGVLIASIVTIVVCNFVMRTNILFKQYFQKSSFDFYLEHIKYVVITLAVGTITYYVCSLVRLDNLVGLFIKACICCCIPNILFVIVYCKNKYFSETVKWVRKIWIKK